MTDEPTLITEAEAALLLAIADRIEAADRIDRKTQRPLGGFNELRAVVHAHGPAQPACSQGYGLGQWFPCTQTFPGHRHHQHTDPEGRFELTW